MSRPSSKKYLGEKKLSNINANKLNTSWSYWKKNREQIIKYCVHDAYLTKRLADYFWQLMNDKIKEIETLVNSESEG